MLNELRDLDGTTVSRGRSSADAVELILFNGTNLITLEDINAVQILRDLCDEVLDDQVDRPADTSPGDLEP